MKALVLAGGRGTRLRPITHTSAKQLVPVANKPVLFYGLEAIQAAGIREVGIVVGDPREMLQPDHRTGEMTTVMVNSQAEIRAAVGDGSAFGLQVTYIEQEAPLGLAHVKNPSEFGVAELQGDRVVRLEEKPEKPTSDLALVGVYLFGSCVFEAVRAIRPSRRGELEITDAIQHLISSGKRVRSHVIGGWWKDTGKVEDMLEGNRMMLGALETKIEGRVDAATAIEGMVRIGKGAVVERSRLRGPLVIGEGARVTDAYVGPFTSVGPGVELSHCEIEHSIVLERTQVIDVPVRIESSLIGKEAIITASKAKPRAHRLMVGDSSRVELA